MASLLPESNPNQSEQCQSINKTESAENFQKFIYELFDKNGILNDLRAYLRGHIVNVLNKAQAGDPSSCQKHFTQRVDSTFQAINMLVAEYLLCLEFNYSLSVFVSEIPLANMVFGFAKSLIDLGVDEDATGLRFKENDIWSIINYLGVKCDAEHVNKIVDKYKAETKSPLLLCILKHVQLADMEQLYRVSSQEGSIASSMSSNTDHHRSPARCKHYALCKACHRRYKKLKNKYREKKKHYNKSLRADAQSMESLMKNIGALERNLTDETFEQLKAVYEAELDMIKKEHEGKIKNSLASHMQHFQRMKNELEESFKSREAALESSILHKKRFLWGLAQALRTQHSQMTKAMQAVTKQTAELAEQEQNIKTQRYEAEESLKKHAESMRQQIADELVLLERHLESMKTERESMSREKSQLDLHEAKINNNEVKNYLKTHYKLLTEELGVLRTSIENATFQPKRLVERCTITEDLGCKGLNNEIKMVREDVRPTQVVNDLKKQKNVNFNQFHPRGARSGGSSSSEDLDVPQFVKPNERVISPQRPQPETSRVAPPVPLEHSMRESIQESGWHKGAGEERGLLASARILVPGDTLPFVGVIADRRGPRRHLLNRWRALRRRVSPLGGPELASVPPEIPVENVGTPEPDPSLEHTRNVKKVKQQKEVIAPVSVTPAARDKAQSPSAMLREAKQRLRKLEIEADVVARSYNDFRRRADSKTPDFVVQHSSTPLTGTKLETHNRDEILHHSKPQMRASNSYNFDMEKYLMKYQFNLDTRQDNLRNNTNTMKKPIPNSYSDEIRKIVHVPKDNYLEKPIHEFRKLYYPNSIRIRNSSSPISRTVQEPAPDITGEKTLEELSQYENEKNNAVKELEILKQNMLLHEEPTKEISKQIEETSGENYLTVEVENFSEVNNLKGDTDEKDMTVIVKGTVDSIAIVESEHDNSKQQSMNMTTAVSPAQIDESNDANDRSESVKADSSLPIVNTSIVNDEKQMMEMEDNKVLPINDIEVEINKDPGLEEDLETGIAVYDTDEAPDDYPDDFSYDVDNYKSGDENSPISLPKTSEDENFWD